MQTNCFVRAARDPEPRQTQKTLGNFADRSFVLPHPGATSGRGEGRLREGTEPELRVKSREEEGEEQMETMEM